MTTTEHLRRLTEQSRVRLAAVEDVRVQHELITRSSRLRLESGRRLLDRHVLADRV